MNRCSWAQGSSLMEAYHDLEWGVPLHDDEKLFELLILEGFQAGLSWSTILNKRKEFRSSFDGFDPLKIGAYDEGKIEILMQNKGIVRNRRKIEAAIRNAQAYLQIRKEFGSFDNYIWQFTEGKTIDNQLAGMDMMPVSTPEAERMSRALKARDFKFVGPTICYAFMQSAGMVNDHLMCCFRYEQIKGLTK